jgi:phosphotransferase system HPr (HPr) family protein
MDIRQEWLEDLLVLEDGNDLHLQTAVRFAAKALPFESEIRIARGNVEVDGKSPVQLASILTPAGQSLVLRASGPDAAEAIETLKSFAESGFPKEKE